MTPQKPEQYTALGWHSAGWPLARASRLRANPESPGPGAAADL